MISDAYNEHHDFTFFNADADQPATKGLRAAVARRSRRFALLHAARAMVW